ncbi:hypothetical protein [Streptomyces sp. ODS28]|uniref:hypothetical protein n=1 Tax=Streptomyces sp. ODS28 TaxID=3136688 RepID=UPI0031E96069
MASTVVLLAGGPAAADSKGKFSAPNGKYAKASGSYQVNNRAGDDRVWFKGKLTKKVKSGCELFQAGVPGKHWLTVKKKCSKGSVKLYKKYDYGKLDSYAYYRLCHRYDDFVKCGKVKHIKL